MDFVAFSSIVWDDQGGAHRPIQLARALADCGHRILFVDAGDTPPQDISSQIGVTSLGALGMTESERWRAWFGFDEPLRDTIVENIGAALDHFERGKDRVAIWHSSFPPFLRQWPRLVQRGYVTVYDCLDDFSDAPKHGYYFGNARAEEFLVKHSDLVTTVTRGLVDKFQPIREGAALEHLPNGVDPDFRARQPVPEDLQRGKVSLGFWGTMKDFMVDAAALEYVARTHPDWHINLIGRYDPDPLAPPVGPRLKSHPNIHLLGPRPHEALMNYLSGFDACLIPFPDNAFGRGRDPLKLYEYLAGYKPVITLRAPQLAGVPGVWNADSAPEFVTRIEQALASTIDRGEVDRFLAANSWSKRAEALLGAISRVERGTVGAAPLPDSFEDTNSVDDRTRAYISHLEQAAAQRLEYCRRLEEEVTATQQYIDKLERTHPLIRLRDAWRRVSRKD